MYSNYQYAKTLLDLSNKSDAISLIQNQLKSVSYLYNKVPAFRLVFVTKRIDTKKKIEIIKNTLKNFNPLIIEFISILIKNNQTNNLLDITTRFDNMASADSKISNVEITTSEKLNNEEVEHISKAISDKIKIKPKLDVKTDPSIIGGIKLRVGNKIFDNSVSYQIKQLKKTLHNM